MSASDFEPRVRAATRARAMGKCEWCGERTDTPDLHHRVFRSRGGTGSGSNAVALCRPCHRRAHDETPGDAEAAAKAGMSIPSGVDPATVSILSLFYRIPIWILANGDYLFAAPATPDLE